MQEKFIVRRMEPKVGKPVKQKKKNAQSLAKTAGRAVRQTNRMLNQAIMMPVPPNLSWLYGFGLKIGVLLLVKSVVVMWFFGGGLALFGWITVASQAMLGFVFMLAGAMLQQERVNCCARSVRRYMWAYLLAGIGTLVVSILKNALDKEFFRSPKGFEWFVNLFTGAWRGLQESGMEVLFFDRILWALLAFLLFAMAYFYVKELTQWEKKMRRWKKERRALQRAA